MKELKMFMFEGCPHCKRAEQMIESLLAAHPEYKDVPFVRIDEKKEPELADKYDYYYVPLLLRGRRKNRRGRADGGKRGQGLRGGLQRLGGAPC